MGKKLKKVPFLKTIVNIVVAVAAVLVIVGLALPFASASGWGVTVDGASGFDILGASYANETHVALVSLTLTFACILLVFALLRIFIRLFVSNKIATLGFAGVGVALMAFSIAMFAELTSSNVGAGLILCLVFGIIAGLASVCSFIIKK